MDHAAYIEVEDASMSDTEEVFVPEDTEEQNLPEGAEHPDDQDFNPDLPDEEEVV